MALCIMKPDILILRTITFSIMKLDIMIHTAMPFSIMTLRNDIQHYNNKE